VTSEQIARIREKLIVWGKDNYQTYSWRAAETPWEAIIAEVLLQRTNARHVETYLEEVLDLLPTPDAVGNVTVEQLESIEQRFGFRRRSKTLQALAEYFLAYRVPRFEELVELYGVGHYTAAAFLSLHMGQRASLVDSNISRWLSRMTDQEIPEDPRRADWLFQLADRLTPDRNFKAYNYAALDFTMQVCVRRKPGCDECPLAGDCLKRSDFRADSEYKIGVPRV